MDALDLDRLRSFVVFAEHMNFTHAARELAVTQPALHSQVSRLADDLGVRLYRRVGRKLELTREGIEVLRFGREIAERGTAFLSTLRGGDSKQTVVLAAGEGSYLYLLGPAIREFTRQARSPLRLVTRDRDGTLAALRSGEAHVGVAPFETPPPDLLVQPLTAVGQALALPRRHPLAKRERAVCLTDLDGAALVVPPLGRPHRSMVAQALATAGVSWRVAVEANGWELMLRFVELGMGLAIVNAFCRPPAGVVLRPLGGLPVVHYHVIHHESLASRESVARLRQALLSRRDSWRERASRAR